MNSAKIRMLLVPDGGPRVKQYSFPKLLLYLSISFFILWAAMICWSIGGYVHVKMRLSQIPRLERENHNWQKRLIGLAQRIDEVAGRVGELGEIGRSLNNRVGLETREPQGEFNTLRGWEPDPLLDDSMAGSRGSPVSLMFRSLADINKQATSFLFDRVTLYTFVEGQNRLLARVRPVLPGNEALELPIQTPDSTTLAVGGSPEAD